MATFLGATTAGRPIGADVTRRKRRQVLDTMAAALILQGWLDANDAKDLHSP